MRRRCIRTVYVAVRGRSDAVHVLSLLLHVLNNVLLLLLLLSLMMVVLVLVLLYHLLLSVLLLWKPAAVSTTHQYAGCACSKH